MRGQATAKPAGVPLKVVYSLQLLYFSDLAKDICSVRMRGGIMDGAADSATVVCSLNLVDVLSIPTIGAAVLSSLGQRYKTTMRQTCSVLCAVVRHVVQG
jgi:hypothetical protein